MAINIKGLIASAMVTLLETRPFSEITVKEICAASGASRQTFYNHFLDKYDLVVWICRKQCEELWSTFRKNNRSLRESMLDVYTLFYNNRSFYSVVMKMSGPNTFQDFLSGFTQKYYYDLISECGDEIDCLLEYAITFYSTGTIQLAVKWCAEGFEQTPEQMVENQMACCPEPLKKYVGL